MNEDVFPEPIIGTFSVITEGETFEVVGRSGGPAGVIGAEFADGVEVELDGADHGELCAVRVWHDGSLSEEQRAALWALFGEQAAEITALFGEARPRPVGGRRRLLSRGENVPEVIAQWCSANDAMARVETPRAVLPLLWLMSAATGAERRPARFSAAEIQEAAAGLSSEAQRLLVGVVEQAEALGILATGAVRLGDDRRAGVFASVEALEMGVAPLLSSSVERSGRLEPVRPLVSVDVGGLFSEQTRAVWGERCNLEVSLRGVMEEDGRLWARARRDNDGCVIAAAPLVREGNSMSTTLLVGETDHLVVDVVVSVAERPARREAGLLARAFDAGRAAARAERLGDMESAQRRWEECARFHAMAGDGQRQKMALQRAGRPMYGRATLLDHVLG